MNSLYSALFCLIFGFACAYFELTSPVLGFCFILLSIPFAILSGIPVIPSLFRRRKLFKSSWLRLFASVIGLVAAATIGYQYYLHPLYDISSDTQNPPAFERSVYRIHVKGGLENLGPEFLLDRSFKGNSAVQAQKYKDISPLIIKAPISMVAPVVTTMITNFPEWKLVHENKEKMKYEFETTSETFHLIDDVVVEVRPVNSQSTQIVVRSRSRVAASDLGANAKRVLAFLNLGRVKSIDLENRAKLTAPPQNVNPVAAPVAPTPAVKPMAAQSAKQPPIPAPQKQAPVKGKTK